MKTILLKTQYDELHIDAIAQQIVGLLPKAPIWAFYGPLGAGKTTLIGSILRHKGVTDSVVSPTFAYVNRYVNDYGEQFFHFDLYRLIHTADFFSAGFDEYLYVQNSWVFIEWPEIIAKAVRGPIAHVVLAYDGLDNRMITIELVD